MKDWMKERLMMLGEAMVCLLDATLIMITIIALLSAVVILNNIGQ